MQIERRTFIAGAASTVLAACTPRQAVLQSAHVTSGAGLAPLAANPHHLMKVTVCLRPFRPAGPRLEVERFGKKTVIHNYGHGGSGWSLSWGCAEEAVALARSGSARKFAVIGAGVIGLTTAMRLVETGADVTIYASEFPSETRSARATGVWSPSSRIALSSAVDPAFTNRWERWARKSYPVHRSMVGLLGTPVEYIPEHEVRGGPSTASGLRWTGPRDSEDFLRVSRRVRDLSPPWQSLEGVENPFPGREVSRSQSMIFNVASYSDRLARMFMLRGGKMVRRSFPDRAAALALPEDVIVNCMGYGAKAIWGDETLVPVRGQISWLLPQPEARYAVFYGGVFAVSRRDGVIVQFVGPNDGYGYGSEDESADPAETERALAILRDLYSPVT